MRFMPIRGIVYGNTEPIRRLQSLDKQLSFGQQKGLMGREGNNTNIRRADGLGQYTIHNTDASKLIQQYMGNYY